MQTKFWNIHGGKHNYVWDYFRLWVGDGRIFECFPIFETKFMYAAHKRFSKVLF